MSDGDANPTVSQVMNVRDKTLSEQYEPHDLLQGYVTTRLEHVGLTVKQNGLDDRHNDSGEITFGADEGPDLAVLDEDGELLCYVEVKSKRSTSYEWFGRLNRRHWEDYLYGSSGEDTFDGATDIDVPVFLYFGVVDEEEDLIIRDGFIEVKDEGQVEHGFPAHGNLVVCLDEDDFRNYQWLWYRLGL